MGMRYFSILTGSQLVIEPVRPYRERHSNTYKTFLMPTAKEITLAEYNPVSGDAITAHRLSDYRQRRFSLVLLPNIHILLEDVLSIKEVGDVSM